MGNMRKLPKKAGIAMKKLPPTGRRAPQDTLMLNHTFMLRIVGWLHALMLFWCFYPFAALIFRLDSQTEKKFALTGLFLLLPIILSWYAIMKLKYLILYFFVSLVCSAGYALLGALAGSALGIGFYPAFAFSLLCSLLIFFIRGYGRIKKGQVQKMLRELPSADLTRVDYSELEVPVFLDTPSPLQWIYFALHYVLSALLKLSFYWHMIFYLFLADVFLCFIYLFTDSFYSFLHDHSKSANLPVKTMEKVVKIIFGIACVILLAFTLPSLLYGKEPLSNITFEKTEPLEEWVPESEPLAPQEEMPDWREMIDGEEEPKQPPAWLVFLSQVIFYLICVGAVLAILVLIYRACRSAGKFFASESEDEIRFLEKGFDDQKENIKKGKLPWLKETSANMRIRKYYKKLLRKGLKGKPQGSETPTQLESMAGISEDESRRLLHDCYEKARYSEEGCTMEEAGRLKKLPTAYQ